MSGSHVPWTQAGSQTNVREQILLFQYLFHCIICMTTCLLIMCVIIKCMYVLRNSTATICIAVFACTHWVYCSRVPPTCLHIDMCDQLHMFHGHRQARRLINTWRENDSCSNTIMAIYVPIFAIYSLGVLQSGPSHLSSH